MSRTCELLTPYVDGELEPAAAERFALHLAVCPTCPAALHEALQLAAIEAEARARAGVGSARAWRPRVIPEGSGAAPAAARSTAPPTSGRRTGRGAASAAAAVGVGALAAAALVLVLVLAGRGGERAAETRAAAEPRGPIALDAAPHRSIEGRLSYATAAAHRPYETRRAGEPAAPTEPIGLEALAQLERRGDLHGLAAAHLLRGEPARALAALDRAAPDPARAGPDLASDRALALLVAGKPAEALVALDALVERAPDHAPARWNRALALRELALPLSAIEGFEAVAARAEPGWAGEAKRRATELAAAVAEPRDAYQRLIKAGDRLATAPDAISPEDARRFAGAARSYLYDAVRGAASADLVRRLAPLARELDGLAGSDHLARYLDRVARADFARRAPLAARYARIVAGERPDPAAARAYLAELRAAGPAAADILLGALLRASPDSAVPEPLLPEYRALAAATGDPWFALLAAEQRALLLEARGEYEHEEVVLLGALGGCEPRWLEFRCVRLELRLAWAYVYMNRLPEADRLGRAALARAHRIADWNVERRALQLLANVESRSGEVGARRLAVARAYTRELALRNPERCVDLVFGHKLVAMMLVDRPDLAGAKRELDAAARVMAACPAAAPDVAWVFLRAHVLRDPAAPAAEVAALRAEIDTLRRDASPADRALLDHSEGRALIERDRAAATALLERAIAETARAPAGDAEGRRARSFSYGVLAFDAARAGAWERAWQLLVREADVSPAARCTLGVAAYEGRSLAVVRDASGTLHGSYDPARRATDDTGAAPRALVPEPLRARLAGCEAVEVVARAPVHGAPGLLGNDLAWSYRSGRTPAAAGEPGGGAGSGGGGVVVIANTEPPALLGLPRLAAWRSRFPPDRVVEGGGATPSRALAELAGARYAELHVHGMVNAAVPDAAFLMMSPESDERYALTAAMIRKQPLRGRPIVVLAACHAASTAPNLYQPWSLPAAFIDAGARAVIASTDVIEDASASELFDDLRARLDRGVPPAIALRDARRDWLLRHPTETWVGSLMVFQ